MNFDRLASDIVFSNKVMKYGHFHHPSVFPEAIRSVTKRFRSHDMSETAEKVEPTDDKTDSPKHI